MSRHNLGLMRLTDTGTTALYKPGQTFEEDTETHPTAIIKGHGNRIWRYVKNGEGATAFAAGQLIVRKAGTTELTGVIGSTTPVSRSYALGVAQHAIAAGSYGWILCRGAGSYLADTGGTTIDHLLIPGNAVAGTFDSQVNTTDETAEATQTYGIVLTAALATATGLAYFNTIP